LSKLLSRALLGLLLCASGARAQSLPSPQIATPALSDDSNLAVDSAWVRGQGYIGAAGAPVQSVVGLTGAITSAEIATALANAAFNGVALTGATIGGNPIAGVSGTWTAGNCVEAGTLYTVVVASAPCGTGSGSTYTLPDATATTLGGITVSTGLSATSGALSVLYGTAAGTAAQGNDSRITGALQAANNLSDLASASTARSNLGLGALATAAYPAAGIVQSSGTALSPITIGSGLAFSSGTLSATGTAANVSSYAVATPASGGTVTIAAYGGLFYTQQINPTNTVTALTIDLPAGETDGERVTIASNASMSGMTLVPPSGQTLGPNMPSAISAGTGFTLQVQAGVWERVQ